MGATVESPPEKDPLKPAVLLAAVPAWERAIHAAMAAKHTERPIAILEVCAADHDMHKYIYTVRSTYRHVSDHAERDQRRCGKDGWEELGMGRYVRKWEYDAVLLAMTHLHVFSTGFAILSAERARGLKTCKPLNLFRQGTRTARAEVGPTYPRP